MNYGAGNLKSLSHAFQFLGYKVKIISSPEEATDIDRLIIPGVGSFGAAMREIKERNLYSFVADWIAAEKPLLGICLGLQLLCEGSDESLEETGFSVFSGRCEKIQARKIPHIGWNEVRIIQDAPLFHGFTGDQHFYFVHSFARRIIDSSTLALTDYGIVFSSVLKKNSVYACQFHPEKSGETGLRFLTNWVERC